MARVFLVCIFVSLLAKPASAATLPAWSHKLAQSAQTGHDPFQEALEAYALSYRDVPGPSPLPIVRMSVQLPMLLGLGWWVALVLPRSASRKARRPQAALAAWARSRMR